MPRSLDDFRFLRENLLVECPDACIPSLEGYYSPFLLSPSRPSKTVLAISARRLDMFLNYLSDHPVLANHELVWEFMLMPELQVQLSIVSWLLVFTLVLLLELLLTFSLLVFW